MVKYNRRVRAERDRYISIYSEKHTEKETALLEELFVAFVKEHQIAANTTQEEFNTKYAMKWFDYINDYNNKVIDLDGFSDKYGKVYQNAYTRRALRVLEQFLKNMLTATYVRDVAYNIKGRLTNKEAAFYSQYYGNVKIDFIEEKVNV